MSHHRSGQLSTPFVNPHGTQPGMKEDADDLFDRNPCPYFAHPHDMGHNTIPVVFEEGVLGKRYHGANIQEESAKLSTTMGKK